MKDGKLFNIRKKALIYADRCQRYLDKLKISSSGSRNVSELITEFPSEKEIRYDTESSNMYCLTPKCASSNWKRLATAIRMNWTFEELEERKKDIYHAVPSLFDLQKRKEKIQMEDSGIKYAQVWCSMFFIFF